MKKTINLIASGILFAANASAQSAPKNIIFMIGDGMGPAYTTAYRYYMDDKSTPDVEQTVFDSILVGMARTYPDDKTVVTDSAAAATALSTGQKTYNGAIAVSTDKKPIKTMLEVAKEKGMTTALVATSQVNHATPASFVAHNDYRRNYDDIANDFVDNRIKGKLPVDLILGGGTEYFIRDDRDIVEEFKKAGYIYTDSLSSLHSLDKLPAIGLFAPKGLPHAIDQDPNRLEKMTSKALSLLDKQSDKGFFAMIEGSQIDWCAHSNDIACAMHEMHDFANAIKAVKHYIDSHPDTLLVVTADHSTGGVTLGANGQYRWERDVVKGIKGSAEPIAKQLFAAQDMENVWVTQTSLAFDKQTQLKLKNAKNIDLKALTNTVKQIINEASYTGWTTTGHTAVDVQVFAYGQGAEHFIGGQNNTDIAAKLLEFISK
jgi:alkaline phosphatase